MRSAQGVDLEQVTKFGSQLLSLLNLGPALLLVRAFPQDFFLSFFRLRPLASVFVEGTARGRLQKRFKRLVGFGCFLLAFWN